MCVINIRFLSQHLGTGGLYLLVVCMFVPIPQWREAKSLKQQY